MTEGAGVMATGIRPPYPVRVLRHENATVRAVAQPLAISWEILVPLRPAPSAGAVTTDGRWPNGPGDYPTIAKKARSLFAKQEKLGATSATPMNLSGVACLFPGDAA